MSSPVAFGIRFALDVALKATVLFGATGLALFALRRASAATRHMVGTAGLAAALAVGARLAVGWARVRRIARDAVPLEDSVWIEERDAIARGLGLRRRVAMLESEAVPVAMTSGLLRPLLLLGRAARTWAIERR